MRKYIVKSIFPISLAVFFAIMTTTPAHADSALVSGASDTGDADQNSVSSITAFTNSQGIGGADSSGTATVAPTLATAGPNTGGADSSSSPSLHPTLPTTGQSIGGADSSSSAASTTLTAVGKATGGADSSSGQDISSTTTTLGATGQSTGGADSSTALPTSTLSTAGQNTGGADASTTATTTVPAPMVTVTVFSNNTNSGGGSFGGSSSGGSYLGFPNSGGSIGSAQAPVATAFVSCPLMTSPLKYGGQNDPLLVSKLQIFLKDSQNRNVAVTGIFDKQTEDAVDIFQERYVNDVMAPWGTKQSSGYVYITTLKKINQLACDQPLTLSASEQAIIDDFKAKAATAIVATALKPASSTAIISPTATSLDRSTTVAEAATLSPTASPDTGSPTTQTAVTAGAGNISFFQSIWNAIKSVF